MVTFNICFSAYGYADVEVDEVELKGKTEEEIRELVHNYFYDIPINKLDFEDLSVNEDGVDDYVMYFQKKS